jgi:hypothetical protein
MYSIKSKNENDYNREIQIPDEFPFPYAKPYDIQLNFMKSLYKTLELGKIGIFESPTGTVCLTFNKRIQQLKVD